MKLNGRRESTNVDDRRGMSAGKMGGMGIGGIVIIALITLLSGGNLGDVFNSVVSNTDLLNMNVTEQAEGGREFTQEEQELAKFSKQILAGTEDVWTQEFKKLGRTYEPPRMVLYTGSVQTACGNGQSSMGPFYCSADQCLYIDLSFFSSMKKQLGADGDFAYAYVIAHEVGHHVEYLLGTLGKAHEQMSRLNQTEANKVSVRLELLADFYAGVWAYHDNQMFGSLEDGDLEEAIRCAQVIGDNYLQEKARGYSQPETFTHGTSKQRMKWLKLGFTTGDIRRGNTFQCSDAEL
ncbi:MAG: neutral zinc metallopeptidase [Bacteroidaceae bacterium]|nr:neutral zinc metallopeptidase [Bacteroidaceae bacterium]